MKKNSEPAPSPKAMLDELETLVAEAEEMAAESESGVSLDNGVDSLRDRFAALRERFGEVYTDARDQLSAGAQTTEKFVRANPFASLALAAGAGVLVGLLVARRK